MQLFFKVTSILLISLILQSCSSETSWTEEEMKNIEHFYRSQEADLAAVDIDNRIGFSISSEAGSFNFRKARESDIESYFQILKYKEIALQEAELVKDSVLDKAHPELREHFRKEYQRGLELQLTKNDVTAGLMGSALHNQWVDWVNTHKHEIKIPKKR